VKARYSIGSRLDNVGGRVARAAKALRDEAKSGSLSGPQGGAWDGDTRKIVAVTRGRLDLDALDRLIADLAAAREDILAGRQVIIE